MTRLMVALALLCTATDAGAARRFHGFHAHPGGGFHHPHARREDCRWRRVEGERRPVCW